MRPARAPVLRLRPCHHLQVWQPVQHELTHGSARHYCTICIIISLCFCRRSLTASARHALWRMCHSVCGMPHDGRQPYSSTHVAAVSVLAGRPATTAGRAATRQRSAGERSPSRCATSGSPATTSALHQPRRTMATMMPMAALVQSTGEQVLTVNIVSAVSECQYDCCSILRHPPLNHLGLSTRSSCSLAGMGAGRFAAAATA